MTTTVNVSRRIVVNGVEYESVDKMPPEIRAMWEHATALAAGTSVRGATPGRMVAWMLLAAAVIGLLLLIYSSPR